MYGLQGDLGGEANYKKKRLYFSLVYLFSSTDITVSNLIISLTLHELLENSEMFICGLGNHYWTLFVSVCRCMCGVCM